MKLDLFRRQYYAFSNARDNCGQIATIVNSYKINKHNAIFREYGKHCIMLQTDKSESTSVILYGIQECELKECNASIASFKSVIRVLRHSSNVSITSYSRGTYSPIFEEYALVY